MADPWVVKLGLIEQVTWSLNDSDVVIILTDSEGFHGELAVVSIDIYCLEDVFTLNGSISINIVPTIRNRRILTDFNVDTCVGLLLYLIVRPATVNVKTLTLLHVIEYAVLYVRITAQMNNLIIWELLKKWHFKRLIPLHVFLIHYFQKVLEP